MSFLLRPYRHRTTGRWKVPRKFKKRWRKLVEERLAEMDIPAFIKVKLWWSPLHGWTVQSEPKRRRRGMTRECNIEGEEVSEDEVALSLGFANVFEMRRWQTDLGHKISELEYALQQAKDEASRFQWHVRRMAFVLEKTRPVIASIGDQADIKKLILAIDVVLGKGIDWDHLLKDWFVDEPKNSED